MGRQEAPCAGDVPLKGDPEPDGLIGLVLGGAYRLVGRIGEGGMGAVYEAHHLRMQKRVAVKLLHQSHAHHADALERFHREAMIASRLGHPHLVNVIDFGASTGDDPYLVMEFLEGEDLDRRLRRTGRVPLQTAIWIARQTASAVAAVHAKGVVHRDLKPANVFLVQVPGEPDFVKVLDFGVSKIRAVQTRLTEASRAIGTPQYMSPEQASGARDEVDHRTDQWALACIVWEMLSGQAPFSADDTDAIFYQLMNLPPPPLAPRVPNLPSGVEPVLVRALSKTPAERYPSIRAFSRALEMAAVGTWSEMTPVSSDMTKVTTVTDLALGRRVAERLRAMLRIDQTLALLRATARRLGAGRNTAMAGLAVLLGMGLTTLLLTRGRHAAMAAGTSQRPQPASPVVQPTLPSAPTDRRSEPSPAGQPETAPAATPKAASAQPSKAGKSKRAKKGKSVAKAGKRSRPAGPGRRATHLSVDDF